MGKRSGGRDKIMLPKRLKLPNLIKSASDTQRLFCPKRCRSGPGPGVSSGWGAEGRRKRGMIARGEGYRHQKRGTEQEGA